MAKVIFGALLIAIVSVSAVYPCGCKKAATKESMSMMAPGAPY